MVKQISLSRDEAELIVSLLMLTDHYPARNLEDELRKLFGMVDRDTELISIGKSLDEIRYTILCDLKILNVPMFQGWRCALQKRVAGFDSLGTCLRLIYG